MQYAQHDSGHCFEHYLGNHSEHNLGQHFEHDSKCYTDHCPERHSGNYSKPHSGDDSRCCAAVFPVIPISILFLVLALAPSSGIAAERLEPVVVTATRVSQPADATMAAVTTIERDEIERLQPLQFSDLLRGRAGISVSDTGPFGKTTGVFMRGTNSNHTLLLVDGVRMGSATTGAPAWEYLPTGAIERIEIVRGPRSSLYGSDALGGVIQVFTREGQEGPARFNASVGAGSFNTQEWGAGISGGTAATRYSASASHFSTDGIDVLSGVGDSDRDGYDNTSVAAKVSHQFGAGTEWFANLLYAQGRTEFDADEFDPATFSVLGPYSPAYHDFAQMALRSGIRLNLSTSWDTQVALAQSRDELSSFEQGTLKDRESRFDTRRDMLDWQNTVRLPAGWQLVQGLDAHEDHVRSSEVFVEKRRSNIGTYVALEGYIGVHELAASVRYDDNQQFGGHTTGQIGWAYDLTAATRLRASAGTAFKAPSFNDLYYPSSNFFRSNPELRPEESRSVELGLRFAQGSGFIDLSAFSTRVDDLITNIPDANWVFVPTNIDRARLQGLELETGYQTGPWIWRTAFTYLETEDRDTGKELRRRPPATGRVDLDHRWGAVSFGGSLIGQARSFDDRANTDRLSGFATLALRASYTVSRDWDLAASVHNVFDRDYVVSRQFGNDYNQPGRTAFLTLRYQQR